MAEMHVTVYFRLTSDTNIIISWNILLVNIPFYWKIILSFLRKLVLPLIIRSNMQCVRSNWVTVRRLFRFCNSRKMCHHSGYPYINNQCSSLVDITYANYRCHEPERIDVSIGGSILAIFGLVHWMQMRHLWGSLQGLLVIGGNRAKN